MLKISNAIDCELSFIAKPWFIITKTTW